MILTPHILVGAVIGAKTQNLGLIVVLGLIIHFIMDWIPHWDYINSGIKDFSKTKNFKALFLDFIKIAIDGLLGLLIVFLVLGQEKVLNPKYFLFILAGIIISLLPDISLGSAWYFGGESAEKYTNLHYKFLHYNKKEKEGKITFWGIMTQILIIIVCVFLLRL